MLVHSGSQGSGHYYAYIKSFETEPVTGQGQWRIFNDQEVREIDEEDVEKAFGLKYGDATAYLLMYRRC